MIPLKRAFDEKRRLVIPLGAALALNVVLYVGVVYPLGASVRSSERRSDTAAAELAAAQREDQSVRTLIQRRTKTDTALTSFYKEVLPAGLSSARGITYLHLAQLAEQHNLRSSHRSAAPDPGTKGLLERLRISMALQGDYEDLRKFIYQLESGPDFIVIDGLAISQGNDPASPLQLTLNLSTYYRHGS